MHLKSLQFEQGIKSIFELNQSFELILFSKASKYKGIKHCRLPVFIVIVY